MCIAVKLYKFAIARRQDDTLYFVVVLCLSTDQWYIHYGSMPITTEQLTSSIAILSLQVLCRPTRIPYLFDKNFDKLHCYCFVVRRSISILYVFISICGLWILSLVAGNIVCSKSSKASVFTEFFSYHLSISINNIRFIQASYNHTFCHLSDLISNTSTNALVNKINTR